MFLLFYINDNWVVRIWSVGIIGRVFLTAYDSVQASLITMVSAKQNGCMTQERVVGLY